MTSKESPAEPISPEFREEVVAKYCRDIVTGRVVFRHNPSEWTTETNEKINRDSNINSQGIMTYTDPETTAEQKKTVVDPTFKSIVALRMNGIVKDVLNQTQLEKDVASIEARFEAMRTLQLEILVVMRELTPKLEEAIRKLDNLQR